MKKGAKFGLVLLVAFAGAPFLASQALAQKGSTAPKKDPKKGGAGASSSASATAAPAPTPTPTPTPTETAPPPPTASASASDASAKPTTEAASSGAGDATDTTEDPMKKYMFIGLRYR